MSSQAHSEAWPFVSPIFKWKKGGEAQYLESFLRFAPFFPLEIGIVYHHL